MNWREELKPGDRVITSCASRDGSVCIVDRVTKTQIIIGLDRFNKRDGYLRGNHGPYLTSLQQYTGAEASKIHGLEMIKQVRYLASTNALNKCSNGELTTIVSILRNHQGNKDGQSLRQS